MSEPKRESFRSRWGFILACIGSAVGMGNIWLFPTRVSTCGGGAFLIPYLLFVALIGATGVIGEMAFGRATRSGPIDAFSAATGSKGHPKLGQLLGMIPALGSLALAIGYTVVMGWIVKYTVDALTCPPITQFTVDTFWEHFLTMASPFGNNLFQIIALAAALGILMFGVSKGIEKANKVMMPLFFLLFALLGIYISTREGAMDGYRYIFRVDPAAIRDPKTWIFALGQAFFSLSVAGNGTLIYGSYLSDGENIPKSAARVAFFDTLAALLAALVIIPAMAAAGTRLDCGGPGLMFVFLPNLFASMPGGKLIAILFFAAVFFAGLTSLINLYEAPIATVQEWFGLDRTASCCIIGIIGLLVSLAIQGIVSDWMDVLSIYICPLGAGLAGILFFWVLGKKFVLRQVNQGRDKPIGPWFYPMGKYLFCGICVLVLIAGILLGGIG